MIRPFKKEDLGKLKEILTSIDIFTEREKKTMLSDIEDCYLNWRTEEREYFVIAYEEEGRLLGIAAYGIEDMNKEVYDVYWIVVDPNQQGKGIGKALVEYLEKTLKSEGVRKLIYETSSLPIYEPTRKFYEKRGYVMEAMIKDYYAIGDHRCIFTKDI